MILPPPPQKKPLPSSSKKTKRKANGPLKKLTATANTSTTSTPFSHTTKFDVLADVLSDEDLIDLSSPTDPSPPENGGPVEAKVFEMMPPFEDEGFWMTYGNRLRVNGTVEGVCWVGSG